VFERQPWLAVETPVTSESDFIYIKRDFQNEVVIFNEEEENRLREQLERSQNLRRSFTSILGGTTTFLAGANPLLVAPMLKYF